MVYGQHDRPDEVASPLPPTIVTLHGERETLWHVVDSTAPEAEQPAVIRTFSSLWVTREEVQRSLGPAF